MIYCIINLNDFRILAYICGHFKVNGIKINFPVGINDITLIYLNVYVIIFIYVYVNAICDTKFIRFN